MTDDSLPLLPSPADMAQWLAHGPLGALLSALEDRPGIGWVLKDAQSLRYLRLRGTLPHADVAVAIDDQPQIGQTDADRFEVQQAALLRIADLRVQQAGRPQSVEHHFETHPGWPGDGSRAWRVWRWHQPPVLLTVWIDLGVRTRLETELRQAHRQIQAQQLRLAAGVEVPSLTVLQSADAQFMAQLRREIDLSRRESRSVALLLLGLKVDDLPAETAAFATATVAQQLAATTRQMDTVAQIGPTLFGVLLSGAGLVAGHNRAEALRRRVSIEQLSWDGGVRALILGAGVASYPHSASDADGLWAAAQGALAESLGLLGRRTVMARVSMVEPPQDQPTEGPLRPPLQAEPPTDGTYPPPSPRPWTRARRDDGLSGGS